MKKNEAIDPKAVNHRTGRYSDLDQAQGQRCMALQDDPETIRGYVNYHWWLKVA